jgi:transcription initiation factor TFIIIB Brf1 subunit/transcription initiation factor TFIIB
MIDIQQIKECPDCASTNIIYDEKEQQVICQDCGLIYEPLAPEKKHKKVQRMKKAKK